MDSSLAKTKCVEANLEDIIERKLDDYELQFETLKKKVVGQSNALATRQGVDDGASECGS